MDNAPNYQGRDASAEWGHVAAMDENWLRVRRLSRRRIAYTAYDAAAITVALTGAVALRMNGQVPSGMMASLSHAIPIFLCSGLTIFHFTGLYSRIWRLASVSDVLRVAEAAMASVMVGVFALVITSDARWLPASVPVIDTLLLTTLLVAGRGWQRIVREGRRQLGLPWTPMRRLSHRQDRVVSQQRALIVGRPEHVDLVLRHFEVAPDPAYRPVGILDVDSRDLDTRLRRVPILGGADAIEHVIDKLTARNERPSCIILAEGPDGFPGRTKVQLVTAAHALGLSVMRAPSPARIHEPFELEPINLADLLDRPQARLDESVVIRALQGRRVMVTGAGGTIGRELARQIAAAGPAELVLLDCGEFNLYSVDMEIRENYPDVSCKALLCSIRQRQHVMAVFQKHRPEYVFHAAALKHVPLVELNICAGVQTNVIGTRNVADAAKAAGVLAMVQVSTDKAVNPVGAMGATKRLGELYTQALDLEGAGLPDAPRFMTVRFGNVLGSSGSLIPLFERQLARRAPLTVTHPEITRYFMTVHEAVQLVLHSMARAMEGDLKRGRIVVLDMGDPVKIIDIARRMITLAGLVPDRDVPIEIVGLRPGEKLYEELFDEGEHRLPSAIGGVFEAEPLPVPLDTFRSSFARLEQAILMHDEDRVRELLFDMVDASRDTIMATPRGMDAAYGPNPANDASPSITPRPAAMAGGPTR